MSKHTPGPWTIDNRETLRGSNGKQIVVWGAGIVFACNSPTVEQVSNAILISTAPDGLALAKAVLDYTADPSKVAKLLAIDAKARALLEKAGEK